MRWLPVVLLGCAATEPPAAEQPSEIPTKTFEIAIEKTSPSCGDGGVGAEAPMLRADEVIARLKQQFRECYDVALEDNPEEAGRIIEVVRVAADGAVCRAHTSERIGLSTGLAKCIEQRLSGARFSAPGGSGATLSIPVTYIQKKQAGPAETIAALEHCADALKQPTEATIEYTTDARGAVGDVKVDPWKGDQEVLGCVADALSNVPHPPGIHFVIQAKFQP